MDAGNSNHYKPFHEEDDEEDDSSLDAFELKEVYSKLKTEKKKRNNGNKAKKNDNTNRAQLNKQFNYSR